MFSREFRAWLEYKIRGAYPSIFDKKKFIFIHIPKTAGKSIAKVLGTGGAVHLKYRDYESIIGENIQHYYCFSVVRDPYARLRSAYAYMALGGNQSKEDRLFRDQYILGNPGLNYFIQHHLSLPEVQHMGFRPQVEYLTNRKGELAQIDLLHFESIAAEFPRVAARLHVCTQLPKVNSTARHDLDLAIDAQSLAIVNTFYAADFSALGYQCGVDSMVR